MLRLLGVALAALVVFICAAVVGIGAHLDLPVSRRILSRAVATALRDSVRGRIAIDRIDGIRLNAIRGLTIRLFDPEGQQVALLQDFGARIELAPLIRSFLARGRPVDVHLTDIEAANVDASLDADATGRLRIQRAIESPHPSEAPSSAPSRPVHVVVDRARVGHVWVHGAPGNAPLVDAEARDLVARVDFGPNVRHIDVPSVALEARSLPRVGTATAELGARVALPTDAGERLAVDAYLDGDAGGVPVAASALVDGDRVDAVAIVAHAPADRVRRFDESLRPLANVAAHVEVHGTLPELAVIGHVDVGAGQVDTDATVHTAAPMRVSFTTSARDIDARALVAKAPPSDVGANARGTLTIPKGSRPTGSIALEILPGTVASQRVPRAAFDAELREDRDRVVGHIDEPGAPTKVAATLRGSIVDAELSVDARRLERIRRVRVPVHGAAAVRARARVDLDRKTIDGALDATVDGLAAGANQLRHGVVTARARGSLADPIVDASARLAGLAAFGSAIECAAIDARGTARRIEVRATADGADPQRVDAGATIERDGARTRVRDVRLTVTRNGETAALSTASVTIDGRSVAVDGLSIEGFGTPLQASGRYSPSSGALRANAAQIDLLRVTKFAGKKLGTVRSGHMRLDVDIETRRREATGHVLVDLDARSAVDKPLYARINVGMLGSRAVGSVAASVDKLGSVLVTTQSLSVPRGLLDASGWRRATGDAHVEANIDLDAVAKALPPAMVPLAEMRGKVALSGDVERDGDHDFPTLRLDVHTTGLALAGEKHMQTPVATTQVVERHGWRTTDIDVGLDLSVDGRTGETTAMTTLLHGRDAFATIDLRATLPYRTLVERPAAARYEIEHAPFFASVRVPRHRLTDLPTLLKLKGLPGDVALEANAQGPLTDPRLDVVAQSTGLRTAQSQDVPTIDVSLRAHYERGRGTARVAARTQRGASIEVSSDLEARAADVLEAANRTPPWVASINVRSQAFPLEVLPMMTERRIKGNLSGDIAARDVHRNGRAEAHVVVTQLTLGRASDAWARVDARLDGTRFEADARLQQKDGFAEAKASLGTRWGQAAVPSRDPAQPTDVTFTAQQFRAAAMFPFVQGALSDLDGRVDANARFHLDANQRKPTMQGTAAIHDGKFQVPSLGEPFHSVEGTVTLQPDGLLKVEQLSARGVTGRLVAAATAQLDGFQLVSARALVRIPDREALPIATEGEPIGDASGSLDVTAVREANGTLRVDVDVPRLDVQLPEGKRHDLQALEAPDHIRVGVHRSPGKLTILPLGPPERPSNPNAPHIAITVKLHDAEIRRGSSLRVRLAGTPHIDLDDTRNVTGTIHIRGGFLEVQGKRFQIESGGTVSFVGDPSNPELVVTASYDAPDGTRIYADFRGPLESGKVTLRSEPAHTNDEILALILFGTPEGFGASPPPGQEPSAAARAAGIASGVVTQGLNKALDQLTGLEVTTRVDTSNAAAPRPEIEVRIARDITLQFEHVLGVPLPGDNPDTNLFKFDWRLGKHLSLETTFGDKGSSIVDLLWRKHY